MDTASGLVSQLVHQLRSGGALLALVALLVIATMLFAALAVAGLLAPASEPLLVAPFRWL